MTTGALAARIARGPERRSAVRTPAPTLPVVRDDRPMWLRRAAEGLLKGADKTGALGQ